MEVTIYSYHPETFEYLGTVTAQVSPLEAGVVLMTEGTTTVMPPAFSADDEIPIYQPELGDWTVVQDFRKVELYSTVNGQLVEVTGPGPQPANTTALPRPSVFHEWVDDAWTFNTATARAAAHAEIDWEAGQTRAKYITIAPGQEATYLIKAQQARAFSAAGQTGPVPSLVQAEADATGELPADACARILAEEAAWVEAAAHIERERRLGKINVDAAGDAAAIEAAKSAAVMTLRGL